MTVTQNILNEQLCTIKSTLHDTNITCVLLCEFPVTTDFAEKYTHAKDHNHLSTLRYCIDTFQKWHQRAKINSIPVLCDIEQLGFHCTTLQGKRTDIGINIQEQGFLIWVQNDRKQELIDFCLKAKATYNRDIVFINTLDTEKQENRCGSINTDGSVSLDVRLQVGKTEELYTQSLEQLLKEERESSFLFYHQNASLARIYRYEIITLDRLVFSVKDGMFL